LSMWAPIASSAQLAPLPFAWRVMLDSALGSSPRPRGSTVKVHLLYIGQYDERRVVGVYATKELCERAILDRVYASESLDSVEIEEVTVIES
jgi:hypothetical protein